jgi:putative flippase GtrA
LRASQSGLWFALVGASASAVHFFAFSFLRHHWVAELANALGFVLAFGVSFVGHRFLSFQDTRTSVRQSLLRFGVTALAGFASNELVFVALHRGLAWSDLWALGAAMVIAAGQTFLLGRYWAFQR